MHKALKFFRETPLHHPVPRYAVAVGAVFVAIAARLSFVSLSGTAAPYGTFYLAIIVTITLAGRGPAMVAALLGGLAANYFFIAPRFSFQFSQPADLLWAFSYLLVSATLIISLRGPAEIPELARKPPFGT